MKKIRILVVDDEESLRIILKNALSQRGFEVDTAKDGKEALFWVGQNDYHLGIVDIRMPGMDGFELLRKIRGDSHSFPVILITAQDTMQQALEAMKQGAFDYLTKPFNIDELDELVTRALKESSFDEGEGRSDEAEITFPAQDSLVGSSRSLRDIYKMIGKLALSDVTVLIQGESGTGKELIARAIHKESPRSRHPFLAVNVAAIPKELLESELFGHVKGAFTGATEERVGYFEKAGEGVLFLDEIGEMPPSLQVKLLRVLQEREIQRLGRSDTVPLRARIIAATNQNLEQLIKEKKFREDLFYRLNVVPLYVSPLRARAEDVPLLANYFVSKFCQELACPSKRILPDVMKSLQEYPWPGNIRELENVIKRAIVLSPGATIISRIALPELPVQRPQADLEEIAMDDIIRRKLQTFLSKWEGYEVTDLYDAIIKRVEKPLIELILSRASGNQVRAARMLGINRNTLFKKMKDLGIRNGA
ncbi:MAG: sigma-54-dependent Fis family transcriptional regulator [Deltaproteobacteria bacterium]|nr:sigma-54-dependent Fis family transcriptional regulator [Deltaproteobacteria bacterium]